MTGQIHELKPGNKRQMPREATQILQSLFQTLELLLLRSRGVASGKRHSPLG